MPTALYGLQRATEARSGARLFRSQGLLSSSDSTAATESLDHILENANRCREEPRAAERNANRKRDRDRDAP